VDDASKILKLGLTPEILHKLHNEQQQQIQHYLKEPLQDAFLIH
jgi:hypothetical protein